MRRRLRGNRPAAGPASCTFRLWKWETRCSMLSARSEEKGLPTQFAKREKHETPRFYQGHRIGRRGRVHACRTGDRAIDAGNQMAHADKLAEVARHALRRRRDDVQEGC